MLFVDSDDYLAPDTVRTLRPFMEQGIDLTVFGYLVDSGGTITRPPEDRLPLGQVTDLAHFPELLLASPNAWNKLWRRALFLEHGIRYPERIWYEDLATTGKLLAVARTITATDAELYYYVVREGSITRNADTSRNLEIIDAVERLRTWFSSETDGRFDTELEAVAVKHLLLTASVRVLRTDCRSPVLRELREYMERTFPRWADNPRVRQFPRRHRLLLALLQRRQYRMIRWLFMIKDGRF